jgi:ubiquitin carboxyl-terminal hydrolase 34
VRQQQDSFEFFSVLFENLENLLKGT